MNRRRFPWRTLTAGACGAAIVLLYHFFAGPPVWHGWLCGIGVYAGLHLIVGFDVPPKPRDEVVAGWTQAEIDKAIAAARREIAGIRHANDQIDSPGLSGALDRIGTAADQIVSHMAKDHEDLRRNRSFLHAHLPGARQVIERYAASYRASRGADLETRFSEFLETVEQAFIEQRARLFDDDLFELDVHMEAFEARLKAEGIAGPKN